MGEMKMQLNLLNKKTIKEIRVDQTTSICPFCNLRDKNDNLQWFNGGSIISGNPVSHPKCYEEHLKMKLGLNDKGYIELNDEQTKVFSQTTGWETINHHYMKELYEGGCFGNDLFSHTIILLDKDLHHLNTFGITFECSKYLERIGSFKKEETGYKYEMNKPIKVGLKKYG